MSSKTKPSAPTTPESSRRATRRSGATQFIALDLYSKGPLEKALTRFKKHENHNGVRVDTPRPAPNAPKVEPTTPSAGASAKRVRSQSNAPVSAKKGRRSQSVHPSATKKEPRDATNDTVDDTKDDEIKYNNKEKKDEKDKKDKNDNLLEVNDIFIDDNDIVAPSSDVDRLFEQADVLKGLLRQADDQKKEKDETLKTIAKRQVELDVAQEAGARLQKEMEKMEKQLAALAQISDAVKEEAKEVVKIEEVEDDEDDFEGKLVIDEGDEEEAKENNPNKPIVEEAE